jgi:general secretion pathway protein M
MKEWWQQLQLREQQLVIGMSVFVGLLLFYTVVWQPLSDGVNKAESKLAKQENLLVWVREGSAQYIQAVQSGVSTGSGGSLSGIVQNSASQNEIQVSRVQPQGENLQVWIEDVPFKVLLNWLHYLDEKEGLHVKNIDLIRGEKEGTVQVRRLMLSR